MRIVGGEARGRKLFAPAGQDTRPTAERVRESLFNILGARVVGARVLDLFAGSGALALEAISRGASSAVLVDSGRAAQQAIQRNILATGAQDAATLIRADWKRAVSQMTSGFDIVFLDPPYHMETAYFEAARALRAHSLLNEGALLVMEHLHRFQLQAAEGFTICDQRRYGEACITLVREETQ